MLSKLPLYHALSIPEVWIWGRSELAVQVLDRGGYQRSPASRCPISTSAPWPPMCECPTSTMRCGIGYKPLPQAWERFAIAIGGGVRCWPARCGIAVFHPVLLLAGKAPQSTRPSVY